MIVVTGRSHKLDGVCFVADTNDHATALKMMLDAWNAMFTDQMKGDPEALRVALATLGIAAVLEPPKPPEGSVWVKVDPTDFEQADDGETTHYGGEIRITNDTHVDIVIKCSGDDRGDDHCYWPTTEGILDALFHTVVPGVVDGDYATKWEDFHDDVCQHIYSGEPFYCYVHREKMAVVLMDPEGDELTHKIPLTH